MSQLSLNKGRNVPPAALSSCAEGCGRN